jgi:hypothetical protein
MSSAGEDVEPDTRQGLLRRYRQVDGSMLAQLTEAGLIWLRTNQELVNSLNVFPVPDGDTGTNMVLTMQAAWQEIPSSTERSISEVARGIAHGALMGARGNSGVILSQLWRGYARALEGAETMDAELLAECLEEARATAYQGVVRPVEGTILTVASDVAKAAQRAVDAGAISSLEVLEQVVEEAEASVERTPELLPVLKEAGVVDSGGMGLCFILEGMLRLALRQPLDQAPPRVQPLSAISLEEVSESIEPGQDWEVVIDFYPREALDLNSFHSRLEAMGTSIQIGEGDGMYRMHIHVADKREYEPIEYVKELGTVASVSLENLVAQMGPEEVGAPLKDIRLADVGPGEVAAVAVAPGTGIARIFASLGAAAVVEGGQTMNPSTQEILAAFENLPTDKVIVLPNNKNILMAARQTLDLTVKEVRVVPSVTVPQGVAAMLSLAPEGDLNSVYEQMCAAIQEVDTAEITTSTRSVEIDGVQVREGQVIALVNGRLAVGADTLEEALLESLEELQAGERELVTLYYGQDLTVREANRLADYVRERYPEQEVEVVEGGQPHYQLILSTE